MSSNFELIKSYYDSGLWSINRVWRTVNKDKGINADEYTLITNCIYPAKEPE